MKLFKKDQKSIEKIIDKIEDLEVKIDNLKIKMESSNSNREKALEEMAFNAKHERIKEYEDRIKSIKVESECKDVVINQQQEEIENLKYENKCVHEENERFVTDLKENELLLKAANDKNKKLEKELKELKDKGMVLPKRVRKTGVTKDTKQVVGIKPSKVSGAAKTELKKINDLREKEEV